ncbi:FkbM family methyltransferase [Oryzifoliimicrobium ureilyticus]|uniref:FkbM family methyltransferase n=1 Tax=Oryzifoliimicrobium ureilyticus TaxID=3113724 RepID=UPI0030766803
MRKVAFAGAAALTEKVLRNRSVQKILFNAVRLNRREIRSVVIDDDMRFLSYCLARRPLSRSQILQDLWVCFELGEKREGYFVEFGATNGFKNSNTWLLETKFGWRGILAEPNPLWHADLIHNRRTHIEHKCVSSKTGDVVSFITTNDTDPELSGIASSSEGDHFAETRRAGQRIELETISLDDMLDKYDAPAAIDYMSVDTEGSELDILSAYSFRHKFKLMSVENNPKNETAIDNLLASKGYLRVFRQFSQWDSWYVSAEMRARQDVTIAAPDA